MRRLAVLIVLSLMTCGCAVSGTDSLQQAEQDYARWQAQEERARQQRRALWEAQQEQKKAERQAQEAKEEAERVAAIRARIAQAKSFDEFRDIYSDCRLRDLELKVELFSAQKKWYLGRYYVPKNLLPIIEADGLVIGMTPEQVMVTQGFPKKIHRTTGSWGVHEQWVMPGDTYLYFENGKLTSWQD